MTFMPAVALPVPFAARITRKRGASRTRLAAAAQHGTAAPAGRAAPWAGLVEPPGQPNNMAIETKTMTTAPPHIIHLF